MRTSTITTAENVYTTTKFFIGKTEWFVTVVTGNRNYVCVMKNTNNPFKTLGNEFANMDAAVANYKNPTMKLKLRMIEMGV